MERKSGKAKWYFLCSLILLLAVLGGGYYYMVAYSPATLEDVTQSIQTRLMQQEEDKNILQQSELDAKDKQIELLKAQSNALKKERDNVSVKLKYSIKPKDKIVAHCKNMKIGRWKMPQNCFDELSAGIMDMVAKDNKIVAFEISGIVDNLPYAGSSPELKQEGLASFRAREAIYIVGKKLPNVAVFEGLSQQKAMERGFIVRAFYVE
ncbi:MAG: hypothetical protein J1E28_01770 [Helicobacter sp.]|uniref:hypothetical protein n=1 Tax=Helicobacter sp. TaxID=218 RepID=UPI0025BCA524|nr:hypothetical protein [Helicobacter sp.]MCH5313115.1 hypothetical protein [Helicobacter sp.]